MHEIETRPISRERRPRIDPEASTTGGDTWTQVTAWLSCVLALCFFAFYVHESLHWIVMWDGAVMHYIHFLITRGLRPYIDITDMNLPGCYLTEGWAMSIFGWGDVAWRVYEYFLMAVLLVAGMVIGGRRHWISGVYAAVLFTLVHGAEGPMMAVERDEVMTVLLVASMACLFVSLRLKRPWLLFPFGLLAGLAVGLKPGAVLLDASLLVLAGIVAHRTSQRWMVYLAWGLGGNLLIFAVMVGYILHFHAWQQILFIARHVLPYYVKEKEQGALSLLVNLLSPWLWPLVALAAVSAVLQREKLRWERVALWLGILSGLASYWVQRKGYLYHRYLFTVFLLLWAGWELSSVRLAKRWHGRIVELAGLVYLFCWASPMYARSMYLYPRTTPPPQNLALGLEKDLQQLGGSSLEREVQCFDLVNGCLNVLYRLRLVQSTGTTGDLLLFSPQRSPAVDYYRGWFTREEALHPPTVIVLGNEYYHQVATSFEKVNTWPEYAAFLKAEYVPVVERHFGHNNEPAYRILLRRGSDVLARERKDPLR